jgi:hypothetical protein
MGVALLTVVAGCQLAARDELRRRGPTRRAAAPVMVPAPGADEAPAPEAPGCSDGAGKCGEKAAPVEDDQARRRLLEELAGQRDALVAAAKELVGSNDWGAIPALAARIAGQLSATPGWRTVLADDIDLPLRETALHTLVCRGLADGVGACLSADALLPRGTALCTDAVRVLQQVRLLRQGLPFERVAQAAGFPAEATLAAAVRAAVVDGAAVECARLGAGPGEPTGWSVPLCRAVATGDTASCKEADDPAHQLICRGLARAMLDAVGRGRPSGRPAEEMYRRWSLGGDAIPECLAEPLAGLAMHPLVQAASTPDAAVLELQP